MCIFKGKEISGSEHHQKKKINTETMQWCSINVSARTFLQDLRLIFI